MFYNENYRNSKSSLSVLSKLNFTLGRQNNVKYDLYSSLIDGDHMIEIFILLIGLAFVDSLNPYSIGLQIYLIFLTRKKSTSVLFIIGIFITYLLCGICVFYGIDLILKDFVQGLIKRIGSTIDYIELAIGVMLLIYAFIKLVKRKQKEPRNDKYNVSSTKTFAIILLGSLGVLSDMPTAVPYLAFIARLAEIKYSVIVSMILLTIYNIIFVTPEILLLIIWIINKDKVEEKLESINRWIQKINAVMLYVFEIGIGLFFIIDSLFYVFGNA